MKLNFAIMGCLAASMLSTSCGGKLASNGLEPKDFAREMTEFIAFNGWEQESSAKLSDTVDLYIDYSTCVAEARNSNYYRTVHPVIVDANPNYYSIKGSNVKFETNNRQTVYQLLNSVAEVNYADIKKAVEQIAAGNNHAVLITDGEYFMKGNVRDNLNNPYMAEMLRTWLRRGLDIYVYCEPYREAGRYDKFRYYFFFTDDAAENNIRERFDRTAPAQSGVRMFHISGKRPAVERAADYPVVNISLSPNEMLKCSGAGYDVQEFYTQWKKIYKYILFNAVTPEGEPMEKGDYLVRGLRVVNGPENGFKVTDLSVRVYNLGEAFDAYELAKMNGEEPAKAGQLPSYKLLTLDKELFAETGEIALLLDKENLYEGLGSAPNLLKVDIVADGVQENFSQNNDINGCFQWQSIAGSQAGSFNTSLYESFRQVLLDPQMNPARDERSKVLYTLYLSTYSL